MLGEELAQMLNYGVTQDGELLSPTWVMGSSRAEFFQCAFQLVLPAHFPPPTYETIYIHNLERCVEIQEGKRGGSKKITHSWCIVVVNVELTSMVAF